MQVDRRTTLAALPVALLGIWTLRRVDRVSRVSLVAIAVGSTAVGTLLVPKRSWSYLQDLDDKGWAREFEATAEPRVKGFISETWMRRHLDDPEAIARFFTLFGYQSAQHYTLGDTPVPALVVKAKYAIWFPSPLQLEGVDLDRAIYSLGIDDLFIDNLVVLSAIRNSKPLDECQTLAQTIADDDVRQRQALVLSWLYHDDWTFASMQELVTPQQVDKFYPGIKDRIHRKVQGETLSREWANALGQPAQEPRPPTPYRMKLRDRR